MRDGSEVVRAQDVGLHPATGVNLRGHLQNAIAIAVERPQKSGFIQHCIGTYASEGTLLHEEAVSNAPS
jgi:hypothetical protein